MAEETQIPIDKGWAWMAMIGTAICMFFVVGMFRSQGILFVEFIHIFGSSYAMSSWMVGVTACGMSLFSPLAHHLAVKYTSRRVVMVGSLLCAIAALLTAWAPNIHFVILVFGSLTGVGYAFMFGPSIMLIGLYFDKRRSLANGLALAGASVGCLVLPPTMTLVIQHYTVWGGLIVYSAFILNGFVAAMLLRPVRFYQRNVKVRPSVDNSMPDKTTTINKVQDETSYSLSMNDINIKGNFNSHLGGSEAMLNSHNAGNSTKPLVDSNGDPTVEFSTSSSSVHALESHNNKNTCFQPSVCPKCQVKMIMVFSTSGGKHICPQCNRSPKNPALHLRNKNPLLIRIGDHYTSKESLFVAEGQDIPEELIQEERILQKTTSRIRSHDALDNIKDSNKKTSPLILNSHDDAVVEEDTKAMKKSDCFSRWKGYLESFHLEHFKNSLFIIYTISCGIGNSAYVDHFIILPPHAEDIGISKAQAAFILSLAGGADLISRVIGGWFADLNLIKRSTLMSLAMVITGTSTLICSFFPSYPSLIVTMVILGGVSGVQIAVFSIVLIDFLGLVKFPSAFGLFLMVQGLFNTAFPPILGWIKDMTGSYSYSFFTLGVALILSAVAIWFEPCARKHEEAKRRRQEAEGVNS